MSARALLLSRCRHCQARFLPRPGACPRCASSDLIPISVAPHGTLRAATAIEVPAAGWPSPHPICLIELAEGTWVLAVGPVPPASVGDAVVVERDGEIYRASPKSE